MHLSHVIYKDKTWLLQESAFAVSLYRPVYMFPRLAENIKNSEEGGEEEWGSNVIHAEHVQS